MTYLIQQEAILFIYLFFGQDNQKSLHTVLDLQILAIFKHVHWKFWRDPVIEKHAKDKDWSYFRLLRVWSFSVCFWWEGEN